jgi:sensor histidine kinase YesM
MLTSGKILFKTKLNKWLLTAIVFLSVFSFSGYSGQSQTRQAALKQTELFVVVTSKTNKPTISYKKALASFFSLSSSISFDQKSILQFNGLTKTKFDYLSKQGFIVFCSGRHFQSKIIPQSQDEEFLISHIG